MSSQLLRTKSIDELIHSSEQEGKRLTRSLGPVSLTALGLGAVIATGIFGLQIPMQLAQPTVIGGELSGAWFNLPAATILLIITAVLVLTGVDNWKTLNSAAPVADALKGIGYDEVRRWVIVGAVIGMVSSLMVFQCGQARVWFAMSRDRLLPSVFSKVHPKHHTPHVGTWVAGLVIYFFFSRKRSQLAS